MRTFVVLSFLFLGAVYWVLSGGASFRPEAWPETGAATASATQAAAQEAAPATPAAPAEAAPVAEATRADTSLDDLAAVPEAPAEAPIDPALLPGAPEAVAVAPRAPPGPSEPLAPADALVALAPDLALPLADPAPAPSPAAAGATRPVTGDAVNLREGPGTGFAVVDRVGAGDLVEVLESRDGWARIRIGGTEGWMSERFLGPA